MLIVCDEHTPAGPWVFAEGDQRLQIPGCRPFPYHNPLAAPQLLERLLLFTALVIGSHACSAVGIERLSGKSRSMAVHSLFHPGSVFQL